MEKTRLMLVDDHDVVRTGLKTFLETQEDFIVVAEAHDGEAAIELCNQSEPEIILMDISMSGIDGLEATRQIKKVHPDIKILALTVHSDRQFFFNMLAAGADGYVTKQVAAEELVAAIRALIAGEVFLQPAMAAWLLEDYRRLNAMDVDNGAKKNRASNLENFHLLSKREIQVLQSVADGLTNIEIGEKLEISHKTVARHRERIMAKLNIHSCAELVKFAISTGLIDLE